MDVFRGEIQLKKLGLSYPKPRALHCCQWKWNSAIFLVYRILMALYTLVIFGFTCKYQSVNGPRFLAYLTVWSYFMLTLHFTIDATVTMYLYAMNWKNGMTRSDDVHLHGRNITSNNEENTQQGQLNNGFLHEQEENKGSLPDSTNNIPLFLELTPWYLKMSWGLSAVINVFGIIVTMIFYGVLVPTTGVAVLYFLDLNLHAVNTILLLIDNAITAKPVRLLHSIYPMIFGLIYVIFSLIYWSRDNLRNVLYPVVLDWNHPGPTVGVILGLTVVAIPLLQLFYFAFYKVRCLLFRKIYHEQYFGECDN